MQNRFAVKVFHAVFKLVLASISYTPEMRQTQQWNKIYFGKANF